MKTPKPQLLPSGRYFIRLRLNNQSYSRTFDSEKEAEAWALSVKAQYKANQLEQKKPPEQRSLRQLTQEYLEVVDLAPNTLQTYKTMMTHFPQAMDRPFASVRNWQRIILLECQKYNPNSVALWWAEIHAVLTFHGIDAPTVKINKKPSEKKNYLDSAQIKQFCEEIKGNHYEAYFLMMLHSLRVSEACNLKDEDITEDGMNVHGTKTEASDRFVPFMIPRLKEIIMDRPPANKNKLRRELQKIRPELTCHSLRISFASACYSKRVPDRIVMKIGGWSSLQVMHNVYVRISDDDVKKYADSVSDLFR